jgi:hypothetical protein
MIIFHRFLISTAILFCARFSYWTASAYRTSGNSSQLALAIVFGILTIALAVNLKFLRRILYRYDDAR